MHNPHLPLMQVCFHTYSTTKEGNVPSHTQMHLLLLSMLGEWGTCVIWYPSGSECQAAPKDADKKQSHRYREQTGLPTREGLG